MIRAVIMGLLLFGVWLLWSGHYTPLLLSLGVGSCLAILVLVIRMDIFDDEGQPIHLITHLLLYAPWLLKEVVVANLDVTKRILNPRLPISPTLFVVEASQQTELGQVIYANSITLTPGTITVQVKGGYIAVHALARESREELSRGTLDEKVAALEKGAS